MIYIRKNGITLIALVITIIIMLILAGVTISIVVNGGLFKQAQSAVNATKDAMSNEASIGESSDLINNYANGGGTDKKPQEDTTGTITQFDKSYGVIDIVWIDTNNNVTADPETPELYGMTPVKWTGTSGNYTEE